MHRILDISKKPIPFSRRVCLVMLFALCSLPGFSQNFPVQVIPQTIPPAPIYVSSYADANTLTGPLRVQIILNDFEIANREIRLKTYFTGSGLNFQSNDIVVGASPLFLEGGVPLVLTHVELAPYFEFNNISGISPNQYGNAIPEGAYQFCVEVYDALTGSRISQRSCAVSVVFQNEPPFLVLPRNKINVDEVNPQYIVFQWTPRSINVSNVAYELSLVEIWDNQVDPQQAFLSSPPVFQTTTSATTYVYGPSDPLLLSGKNYAWRVQAKAKQGLEEIGLFKNQGYSEIYSFGYAGSCDLPIGINHEVKGSTNANIFWDDFSTEIPEYTVRYRKKGNDNEWFESKTAGNFLTLWNLRPGTIYEYQLRKKCSVTESDWSFEKQFTTFLADDEDSIYECGIPPNFDISNKEPLQNLGVNEEFTAGDFPIKVLGASGSNGRFTGKGYVTIPYLRNIRVGVEFTNVLINSDRKLLEGSVNTMYDPSLGNILDIDDAIDTVENVTDSVGELFEGDNDLDEIQVDWTIGSKDEITIEDGMVVITNPNNGVTKKEPLGDDMIITDQEGNTYYVSPEGEITEGGQITPGEEVNPGNVSGVSNNGDLEGLTAENIKVTFNSKGTYGFDKMPSAANTNEKLKKEYTIIKDATGGDYVLPHHAVKKGGTTQIQATIEIEKNAYTPDQVVFKNKQGKIFTPTSINGNTATISLDGVYSFENETIYAVVPSKEDTSKQLTAGAFTLWHLTDRAIDVVLVSVDKASIPNDTETTIKNIFGTGITTINIDSATASLNTSLLGTDGQLEIGDSPWLVAYNEEQKAVIGNLKSQIDYSTDKYYLFVFKNSVRTTKPIAGFMPLQRQFGFLFNGPLTSGEESKGDLGVVASHEIGHGVFALQHPFTQYGSARESTDWLMDSKENEALLSHMDWSQMHDPALKFYLFQDEEDGEYEPWTRLDGVLVEQFDDYENIAKTFINTTGSLIKLPANARDFAFVQGYLRGFTIGNERWISFQTKKKDNNGFKKSKGFYKDIVQNSNGRYIFQNSEPYLFSLPIAVGDPVFYAIEGQSTNNDCFDVLAYKGVSKFSSNESNAYTGNGDRIIIETDQITSNEKVESYVAQVIAAQNINCLKDRSREFYKFIVEHNTRNGKPVSQELQNKLISKLALFKTVHIQGLDGAAPTPNINVKFSEMLNYGAEELVYNIEDAIDRFEENQEGTSDKVELKNITLVVSLENNDLVQDLFTIFKDKKEINKDCTLFESLTKLKQDNPNPSSGEIVLAIAKDVYEIINFNEAFEAISCLLGALKIPSKYYNENRFDFSGPNFSDIDFEDHLKTIGFTDNSAKWLSASLGESKDYRFACACGAWNSLVDTVKGLADLGAILTTNPHDAYLNITNMLKDSDDLASQSFLEAAGDALKEHHGIRNGGIIDNYEVSAAFCYDVVFVLSLYVGLGEVNALVKASSTAQRLAILRNVVKTIPAKTIRAVAQVKKLPALVKTLPEKTQTVFYQATSAAVKRVPSTNVNVVDNYIVMYALHAEINKEILRFTPKGFIQLSATSKAGTISTVISRADEVVTTVDGQTGPLVMGVDYTGNLIARVGDDLANTVAKHPNWVEISSIANKVDGLTPHVLKVETKIDGSFFPKTKNINGQSFQMEGFKGCHSENALKEYVQANGGTYTVKNKSLGQGGVYEGQPVISLNNKEYVKINGRFVEYEPGKLGGTSSFFPEGWSNTKIKQEVEFALTNNHGKVNPLDPVDRLHFGFSSDGTVEIQFYLNADGSIGSYFPKKR